MGERGPVDVRPEIEMMARGLCLADGHDPDSDWRCHDGIMLQVAVEHPQWWRRYVSAAEGLLAKRGPAPIWSRGEAKTQAIPTP